MNFYLHGVFLLCLLLKASIIFSYNHCQYYKGICQADWMANLNQSLQDRRLDQIKLLGTHDSAAALQLLFNETPPMERTPVLDLFKYLAEIDPVAHQIVANLTFAQTLPIIEQLEQGIRALDLRILYDSNSTDFYLCHSYATQKLEPVLEQIADFLSNHSGEVL